MVLGGALATAGRWLIERWKRPNTVLRCRVSETRLSPPRREGVPEVGMTIGDRKADDPRVYTIDVVCGGNAPVRDAPAELTLSGAPLRGRLIGVEVCPDVSDEELKPVVQRGPVEEAPGLVRIPLSVRLMNPGESTRVSLVTDGEHSPSFRARGPGLRVEMVQGLSGDVRGGGEPAWRTAAWLALVVLVIVAAPFVVTRALQPWAAKREAVMEPWAAKRAVLTESCARRALARMVAGNDRMGAIVGHLDVLRLPAGREAAELAAAVGWARGWDWQGDREELALPPLEYAAEEADADNGQDVARVASGELRDAVESYSRQLPELWAAAASVCQLARRADATEVDAVLAKAANGAWENAVVAQACMLEAEGWEAALRLGRTEEEETDR